MMDRDLSFRWADDAQKLVKREAGCRSACEGAWQRGSSALARSSLELVGLVSVAVHTVPCARLLPLPLEDKSS